MIRRELVSSEWTPPHVNDKGEPLEYPLKYVDGIYRVRIADMSEWLLTTEQWCGLDVSGNALNISRIINNALMTSDPFIQIKQRIQRREIVR